ncbi:hypothetical protein Tco_0675529 [Tanacetum coccineum]
MNVLNIAEFFGVPFKTFADIEDLMNGIKMGKHEAVWSSMTEERRKDVMDSMFTMWKRLMDENLSVARNVGNMNHVDKTSAPSHKSPIVQSVDINTKLTSYARAAGASAKDQPKVNSNFRPFVADPVFNGVNISIPRKVVEKILDCLKKNCPKKMVCPPIVVTSNVVAPTVEKTNDGFQTVGKKKNRKGKSKSTNGGQFAGPSVKPNVRYEPKATTSALNKAVTNVGNATQLSSLLKTTGTSSKNDNSTTSNSYSSLNDEEGDVENVYDETANLFPNTKTGGSSSFTASVKI